MQAIDGCSEPTSLYSFCIGSNVFTTVLHRSKRRSLDSFCTSATLQFLRMCAKGGVFSCAMSAFLTSQQRQPWPYAIRCGTRKAMPQLIRTPFVSSLI